MITVVIPAYNHEAYIADAIRSCLNEPEVTEILIGDDGSSDRTLAIIESFACQYPGLINNLTDSPAKNIGAHNRINMLCSMAANDWIAILNSDDTFCSGRFRNFAQLAKLRKPDVVFGNCAIVDASGQEIGAKYAHFHGEYSFPPEFNPEHVSEDDGWLMALLNQNFIATTSNLIVSKSFFEKLGGFRAFRYIHDWDFMLRAALEGRIVYNNGMWVNYRIHSGNTIAESNHRVKAEVRRMVDEVTKSADFKERVTSYSRLLRVNNALESNKYLKVEAGLHLVTSEGPEHPQVKAFMEAFPKAEISYDLSQVPKADGYVYAPSNINEMPEPNELRNMFLAMAMGGYDLYLLSTVLSEHNTIQVGELRNFAFIRRSRAEEVFRGNYSAPATGRVIRMPRKNPGPTKPMREMFRSNVVFQSGNELVVSSAKNPESLLSSLKFAPGEKSSPLAASGRAQGDTRPVVFVLPAVIAVGGAENVMIEVIRQTKGDFCYVAICTAQIAPHQGSWAWRALEHCEAIYDISEACRDEVKLPALAWLKELYNPKALLITNGSMWQMQNAYAIRRLFRDAAIIDHQAYDSNFGWIEWFDHPGIRSSDRFIAVNSRIQTAFLERLNIPSEKVDLIYHPIDAKRIEANLPLIDIERSYKEFSLDPDRPIVAFVGRLTEQKRPWLFLEVARISKLNCDATQFVMVGQGGLEAALREQIIAHELDNVQTIQNIPELEYFYAITDILLITSEYEGVPLAMLEAMSVGVPIVSTDAGDIGAVLKRYSGLDTVPIDGTADDLYAKLKAAIDDLTSLKDSAKKSSANVRHDFSSEAISRKYTETLLSATQRYTDLRAY